MYVRGPLGDGGVGQALRIGQAERAVFGGSSAAALDPALRVYLTDLVRPYGVALRDDLLAEGAGHSYAEMAGALIGATVPTGQPVDVLILAFAMPDVSPERATASYLSHICPGEPMAFALCDQGAATAFTGLRIAAGYAGSTGGGDRLRVLLLIAEQAVLHYERVGDGAIPERHAAVALLCDGAGPARLESVREHADVAPQRAAALLACALAEMPGGGAPLTLILGGELASLAEPGGLPAGCEIRVAPSGQPYTGVWWELAGGLAGWTAQGRRVVVADYDPALRYLCVACLGVEPG
jgi:hypothetical protein